MGRGGGVGAGRGCQGGYDEPRISYCENAQKKLEGGSGRGGGGGQGGCELRIEVIVKIQKIKVAGVGSVVGGGGSSWMCIKVLYNIKNNKKSGGKGEDVQYLNPKHSQVI